MSRDEPLLRGLMFAVICVPLALFLGFLLATPDRMASVFWVGVALALIALPLMIRWHHPLVIIFWNVQVLAFMLPGKPTAVFVLAGISFVISVVTRALSKESTFIHCPSIAYPLIVLAAVVVLTMQFRGGLGGRVFGSANWGASRYLGVLGGIAGYFALVAKPVTPSKRRLMASLFILSGATAMFADLSYLAGPKFHFLLSLFPDVYSSYFGGTAVGQGLRRFAGIGSAANTLALFMMMRYGIRGIFEWRRPWRWGLFVAMFIIGLVGGFRSSIVLLGLLFMIQFYYEKLFQSHLVVVFAMIGMIATVLVAGFADRLPMSMQRSLSFLPINVDPVAKKDAMDTWTWRVEMWQAVAPQIPRYLWLGKGYSFSASEVNLNNFGWRRGYVTAYEQAIITGDYHQGILTSIIPLGLSGFLAFLAFCWGSLRALYANYRYGDPGLRRINTFLWVLFVGRLIWFLTLYGEFFLDLMAFTGIIGLSLALNAGVAKKPVAVVKAAAPEEGRVKWLRPALPIR